MTAVSSNDIRARLERIFGEVFEADGMQFSDALSRENLAGWDSLGHIRLIAATEDEFGVQFTIEEIEKLTTAGKLLERLTASL